jgi:hypothetical protein
MEAGCSTPSASCRLTPAWTANDRTRGPRLPAGCRSCGAEEIRTPDFLLAKEALYQLSYGPWWAFLDSNQRPLPYQGSALTN